MSSRQVYRHGHREALVSTHQSDMAAGGVREPVFRATYSDLDVLSTQFARGLRQLGLQKGDRLGVWLPNVYEYTVAQVAAAKLGIVLVTVNPGYRTSEVEYALQYVLAHALPPLAPGPPSLDLTLVRSCPAKSLVGVRALVVTPRLKASDYYAILNELLPELATVRGLPPVHR